MATSNEKARNAASAERRADIVAAARAVRGVGALENLRAGHHQPHGRGALAVLPLLP
ncbi:MAG: hypothetical protein ACLTMP_10160 [Eggerthella lenta]